MGLKFITQNPSLKAKFDSLMWKMLRDYDENYWIS